MDGGLLTSLRSGIHSFACGAKHYEWTWQHLAMLVIIAVAWTSFKGQSRSWIDRPLPGVLETRLTSWCVDNRLVVYTTPCTLWGVIGLLERVNLLHPHSADIV